LADGKPVLARQHEIEQDQIGAKAEKELIEGAARGGGFDGEPLLRQEVVHQPLDFGVVLDDDDDRALVSRHER
jgi:hypothetical protein